jgi:hypothetical protein
MTTSSDSFRNVTRYQGQDYRFVPTYLRPRDPHSPTSASNDIKPKEQQGYYPVTSLWTNSTNGNIWALAGIVNNLANWVMLSGGSSGPLLNITVPNGTSPIVPDGLGTMHFTSNAGTVVITGSSASPNNHTINFDVLGGANPIEKITGDDLVVVVPDAGGNINLQGLVVANGTHAKAVFTESPIANTEKIDIQVSAAIAATDITKVGLADFRNTQFTVDANGFVSLVGGTTPAILTETADTGGAVSPDGSGNINHFGGNNIITTGNPGTHTISYATGTQFGISNIGFTQSAGTTFTVESASGAAFSSTNPGFVTLQSFASPGLQVNYKVTANQSFTQANIATNNFGLTNGVANANDIPFFLYAVSNAQNGENTIAFMISRFPNAKVSPVAAKIGKTGSAVANSQGSFFSLANVTVADYAQSPCLCIGSFRMTWTAGNNWVITTIDDEDGVGCFQENRVFNVSIGQFGAASGKYFYNNGGTAPGFASVSYVYYIDKQNFLKFYASFLDPSGSAGAGAVILQLALPYVVNGNSAGTFWSTTAGPTFIAGATVVVNPSSVNKIEFDFSAPASLHSTLNNNNFTGATDSLAPFGLVPILYS